jgi:hypothetical protein
MIDISVADGSSVYDPLNTGSWLAKGVRLSSWFSQKNHWVCEEILICVGLYVDSIDDLMFGGTRLILQEEVILEECEIGRNCKVNLAEMDKNGDLKDAIGI